MTDFLARKRTRRNVLKLAGAAGLDSVVPGTVDLTAGGTGHVKWSEELALAADEVRERDISLVRHSGSIAGRVTDLDTGLPLAGVSVSAEVMEVVVALEHAVVFDDPVVLVADVRRKQCRSELRVIGGCQQIANVVQQCAPTQKLHFLIWVASLCSQSQGQRGHPVAVSLCFMVSQFQSA